jgi:hypothetical protein
MVHCLRLQSLDDLLKALWCGSLVNFWLKAVPVVMVRGRKLNLYASVEVLIWENMSG